MCARVLSLSQVLKVPSASSQFFGVKCTTRGNWLGWTAAVAKTFYIKKSFHSCYFWTRFLLFSSCYSDPNAFCHHSNHMIVILLLLPRWHVSRQSHIVSTVICPQMLLFFSPANKEIGAVGRLLSDINQNTKFGENSDSHSDNKYVLLFTASRLKGVC